MNSKYYITIFWAFLIAVIYFSQSVHAQDAGREELRVSENLSVVKIKDGIWVHTSWRRLSNGFNFPANGMIVQHEGEILLIDTAWGPEITSELLEWIDNHLGLPISGVIVTHYHDDSMGGTPVLEAHGIRVLGSYRTRKLGENEGIPLPESIWDLQVGDSVQIANVEVYYPGPGHTEDNLIVWIPHANVLFGSCAVRSPQFPGRGNIADANEELWPKAIRRILRKYPDVAVVVPGHGNAGDVSMLNHTIRLFED